MWGSGLGRIHNSNDVLPRTRPCPSPQRPDPFGSKLDSERILRKGYPVTTHAGPGGGGSNMPEQEFLGELSEKTTSVTIREFRPDGVLISYNLQGTVKGEYDASHIESVDALF